MATLTQLLTARGLTSNSYSNKFYPVSGQTGVKGTSSTDYVLGGSNSEDIRTYRSADAIDSGGGNDSIFGGPGKDIIVGNAGNDVIVGGLDGDVIDGGSGNDIITGLGTYELGDNATSFNEDDILYGGPGADRFDTVYQGVTNRESGGVARIMDFTPNLSNPSQGDSIGISTVISPNDIFARFVSSGNQSYTELIDKRGLDGDILALISSAVGVPLGSVVPAGIYKRKIADIYGGSGFDNNFTSLFAGKDKTSFLVSTSGI
jgi:Ca2+-binding RTX toxin-like protein